jgi:hypothetical protein
VERAPARAHGWLPPLGWDDEAIDDPAAEPDEGDGDVVDDILIERALAAGDARSLDPVHRLEVVRRLHQAGATPAAIAHRLHLGGGTTRLLVAEVTAPGPPEASAEASSPIAVSS